MSSHKDKEMNDSNEKIKAYDKRFEGKMNPRNTFHCEICDKYYNGLSDTILMFDDEGDKSKEDCVHGNDLEITKHIYDSHMEDLMINGFLN